MFGGFVTLRLWRQILNLILPPGCPGCGTDVMQGGALCAACFTAAHPLTGLVCDRCGTPFVSEGMAGPERICISCLQEPPVWKKARGAFVYDVWSRMLILPFKYADRTENARILARFMAQAGAGLLVESDVVVPVPLHRAKLWTRRYNQAALLARLVARHGERKCIPDALCRSRSTRALARLSAHERKAQVSGAFIVRSRRQAALAGKNVLLVDDVLTTGATAASCAKALLDGGAASVSLLVAARTVNPGDDVPSYKSE